MKKPKKKVLLIGCDAADWQIIHPLVDAGHMPAMKKIIETGVIGELATLQPCFSPMLWTSIATGKRADKHGILGFIEPDKSYKSVQPVTSLSRKTKALWNIFSQSEIKNHVVGWWPSHPAEKINGCMISNFFHKVQLNPKEWNFHHGSVHPELLERFFMNLLIHPFELTDEHILPFVPSAASVNQEKDKRLSIVAKLICEAANIHHAATWILENQEWEFAAVYFDMIDHFCHAFMNYHPPKMPFVSDKDFEIYQDVVQAAYRFQDMLISRLMQLAGEDATVVIVSDHGFHSGNLRMKALPQVHAAPSIQHRNHGIFAACGPGIKKDETLYGATLLDIAPTILAMMNLPVGKDMDGMVLSQIFEKKPNIKYIESWDNVDGNHGMFSEEERHQSADNIAIIKQLAALGYIDEIDPKSEKAIERAISDNKLNLVKVLLEGGKTNDALEILKELYEITPNESEITNLLIHTLLKNNRLQEAELYIKQFRTHLKKRKPSKSAIQQLEDEIKSISEKKDIPSEKKHKRIERRLKSFTQINFDLRMTDLLLIDLLIMEGKNEEALSKLHQLQTAGKLQMGIKSRIAQAYLKLKKAEEALPILEEMLKINPESINTLQNYARALMMLKQYEEACEYLLTLTGLHFHLPAAHFLLGQCLFQLKEYKHAAAALEVTIQMAPGITAARNLLINICENHLNDETRAEQLKKSFAEARTTENDELTEETEILIKPKNQTKTRSNADEIIIVSGLPRSGTSLMMQLLEKAKKPILTDNIRTPDYNNPKGYYEFEAIKNLASNKKWIEEAKGKVVKIVSPLLKHLPLKHHYKIIFMHRNLREIIDSQEKMKSLAGKESKTYPAHLEETYKKHITQLLEWFSKKHNMEVLHINYNTLLENPSEEIKKIEEFLQLDKQIDFSECIDTDLYRNRRIDLKH